MKQKTPKTKKEYNKDSLLFSEANTEIIEDIGITRTPSKAKRAQQSPEKSKKSFLQNQKSIPKIPEIKKMKSQSSVSKEEDEILDTETESGFTTSEYDDFESVGQGEISQDLPLEGHNRDTNNRLS